MSSNQLSRVSWGRFALTYQPVDLQSQAVAFDGAARSRWPDAAAPSSTWASTLIQACACGRIGSEVMWDILLAHADAATPPDVRVLLEHLPEAHVKASLDELLETTYVHQAAPTAMTSRIEQPTHGAQATDPEDWFVMIENLGAA